MSVPYNYPFELKCKTVGLERFKKLCPKSKITSKCTYKNYVLYKKCKYCKRRKIKNIFASICDKKSSFKNID